MACRILLVIYKYAETPKTEKFCTSTILQTSQYESNPKYGNELEYVLDFDPPQKVPSIDGFKFPKFA